MITRLGARARGLVAALVVVAAGCTSASGEGDPAPGGEAATTGRGAAPMPGMSQPAGRILLHAYGPDGRELSWAQFRRLQAGGLARDPHPDEGADDALLDARTLQVVQPWPLSGDGTTISLTRPAGAVALSLAWPTSAGYSTLILDLPGPGSYVLNHLAARQAVADLEAAVAGRAGYVPGDAVRTGLALAHGELAAADQARDDAGRAVHGTRAYEAAVAAQLRLLTEYGPWYARQGPRPQPSPAAAASPPAPPPGRASPTWGFTLDDPEQAGPALSAVRGIAAAGPGTAAVRLVFGASVAAERYRPVVAAAHQAGIAVVGQVLDSSDFARTPLASWQDRVRRYTAELPDVDVWEVGNEVNGNWLGDDVAAKVDFAASWVKEHTRARTMLTLYWQLGEDDAGHSVFTWAARHLTPGTMARIDQLGLSVYPENAPLGVALDRVLATLHAAYPAQHLAITELGYGSADLQRRWWWGHPEDWAGAGRRAVADLYARAILGYPFTAGGTYWWYFQDDAPADSPLWHVFAAVSASAS